MSKNRKLQDHIRATHGRVMQTCWIGHVKELNGLPLKPRHKGVRVKPCPDQWRPVIEDAMRTLGWMQPIR
jgi:hypothetical protein